MLQTDKGKVAVVLYTHPEFFPPVLNAIDGLAEVFSRVLVLSRYLKPNQWKYPPAVQFHTSGKLIPIRDSEQKSTRWKLQSFLRFTRDFYRMLKQGRPYWVMCNDPISLWSLKMIRPFLGYRIKVWYQNHDISELNSTRKYSIGYFAVKSEKNYLQKIDLFTLPSEERLGFFPMGNFKGKWLVVPNYPSLRRMTKGLPAGWQSGMNLKLIYQGRVSNEHGLEEIIDFVKTDSSLQLTIIGPGNENYINKLKQELTENGLTEQVSILDPVAYGELQAITRSHHVGLAVNKPVNIQYSTAALASNKIYEYAAAGLPIIYYNDQHYIKFLGKYAWAFPSDLSPASLSSIMNNLRTGYSGLSRQAQEDFELRLNFEKVFSPALTFISPTEPDHRG